MSSEITEEKATGISLSLNEIKCVIEPPNVQKTFSPEKTIETENSLEEIMNSGNNVPVEKSDDETEKKSNNGLNDIKKSQNESVSTETSSNQLDSTEEKFSELLSADGSSSNKVSEPVIPQNQIKNTNQETSPKNQISESLENIQKYCESDSSDSEEDSSDSEEDSSDSEEVGSDLEDGSDSEDGDDVVMKDSNIKDKKKREEESWLSVLGIDDVSPELPDISTLNLNDKEVFIHMGNLESVIDTIVTVAGLPQLPAYDLDTLLFLEEGRKILGYVFDVMGQVTAPVYILQMSSVEKIKDLELQKGIKVYCAPTTQYTKYVLLQELMMIRGSDASWMGDSEVPAEHVDYSDDEQERLSKASKKVRKRKCTEGDEPAPLAMERLPQGGPSPRNTNRTPTRDRNRNNQNPQGFSRPNFRNGPQVHNRLPNPQNWNVLNPVAVAAGNVPAFDPTVPPPRFGIPPFNPLQRPLLPPVNGFGHPGNFVPRGASFNRVNRPFFMKNMPGPSGGNWFQ